jgi:hypothetical protein
MDLSAGFYESATEKFYRAHPNAVITDIKPKKNLDGSITMEIEAVEPKMSDHIPEDLARHQLELYRSAAGPVLNAVPEQTSKSANAASSIDSTPKTDVPRPLWISDLEIRDEE